MLKSISEWEERDVDGITEYYDDSSELDFCIYQAEDGLSWCWEVTQKSGDLLDVCEVTFETIERAYTNLWNHWE